LQKCVIGVFDDSKTAQDDWAIAIGGWGTWHARIVTCAEAAGAQKP
jgi:hypothetical protein